MDASETELAITTIQRMAQENEGLCQQLQDAWAEIRRLRKALTIIESKSKSGFIRVVARDALKGDS